MKQPPLHFAYESMGTSWAISLWDELDPIVFEDLKASILQKSQEFDETYSRFIKTSLVWELTKKQGITEVPKDLVNMLRIYKKLGVLSHGALNPLVGFTLSDLGYDEVYSLQPKESIRTVPVFDAAIQIVDDTHIDLRESVLIDLGALGKGYFVDILAHFLKEKNIRRFLVNGSGDIYYSGCGIPLRAGLEDPKDATKVLGTLEIFEGALCASASNRRAWGKYHHTIDPKSLTSPDVILASWVRSDSAAIADALCTCLFLTGPEAYASIPFEYCLLNSSYKIKRSAGFTAELF